MASRRLQIWCCDAIHVRLIGIRTATYDGRTFLGLSQGTPFAQHEWCFEAAFTPRMFMNNHSLHLYGFLKNIYSTNNTRLWLDLTAHFFANRPAALARTASPTNLDTKTWSRWQAGLPTAAWHCLGQHQKSATKKPLLPAIIAALRGTQRSIHH